MTRLAPILAALALLRPLAATADPALLTLDEALQRARQHQPTLRQARALADAALARADEARAPLLPQLGGTATYERATGNLVPRPGSTVTQATPTSWSSSGFWQFGATLTQVIYEFGQGTGRWRAARALATSQRDSEAASAAQAELGVRVAFFTARATRDLVTVARENLANAEAHLRQIAAFVRLGTRAEIDLALARTARANAEVQRVNAENTAAVARAQLVQAMGDEGPADFEVADDALPPVEGEALAPEALLGEALGRRPDIAALEAQARAQELTLDAVRGAYAPSLGFASSVTAAGPTPSDAVPNWTAGVTLTWNLFQGGLTRAQEREAHANLEAARAQAEVLRQQVRVEVEQARLSVRAAGGALGAATEALASARDQLRLAERRYETGVGSAIELQDSQLALATAAAQRVQAEYNLSTSRAQLLRALGR